MVFQAHRRPGFSGLDRVCLDTKHKKGIPSIEALYLPLMWHALTKETYYAPSPSMLATAINRWNR